MLVSAQNHSSVMAKLRIQKYRFKVPATFESLEKQGARDVAQGQSELESLSQTLSTLGKTLTRKGYLPSGTRGVSELQKGRSQGGAGKRILPKVHREGLRENRRYHRDRRSPGWRSRGLESH